MDLRMILVIICAFIFVLWLVKGNMPEPWKTPVLVVIVLVAVIWLLTLMFPNITSFRVR